MYRGIDENKVITNLSAIVKACSLEQQNAKDEIEREKYDDWGMDIFQAVNLIQILLEHRTPQGVTHEATLYKCPTCPSCRNVVGEVKKFGDSEYFAQWKHCIFCGQALDWSKES